MSKAVTIAFCKSCTSPCRIDCRVKLHMVSYETRPWWKGVFEAHDAVMHLPGRTMPRMLFHTDAVSSMMPICVKTLNWTKDRTSRVCTRCPLLRTMPSRLTASTRTTMHVFSAPLPPHACLYSHQVHTGTRRPANRLWCGQMRSSETPAAEAAKPVGRH